MSRIRWYGPTILLLLTVTTAMALGPTIVRQIARSYEDQRIELIGQRLAENQNLAALSDSFKDIATFVKPSVTSISILARDPSTKRLMGIGNGSGWVYRHYPDPTEPGVYEDVIITNHHVVADFLSGKAEQVIVRFDDGGEYPATDVRSDPKTDIAVLHIDRNDLRPSKIATDPATQGELVFAFGSPFHFEFSMSQGIVSATGRQLNSRGMGLAVEYENYIQTDAAINPGNSGGPLTNVRGEVIGMNTAIATNRDPTVSFSGLGFAIPVDLVAQIADRLLDDGEVRRGYMGVNVYNIDFKTAEELGFTGQGVLCNPVPGSPADVAGIKLGDIITAVDGQSVRTIEEVRIETSSNRPGESIGVSVWRAGKTVELEITLAASATSGNRFTPELWDDIGSAQADRNLSAIGVERLETMLPDVIVNRGWAYTPGVLVRRVDRGGAVQRAGLQPGMIITYFNGTPIVEIDDLTTVVEGLRSGDPVYAALKKWDTDLGRYDQYEIEFVMP